MSSEVKASTGKSRIRQLEVFDMNKDGADDLVIVFESGELDIFYGGTRLDGSGKKVVTFTRKVVDSSLKIRISSEKRDDGGAIYFPGLAQLPVSDGQSQSQTDFLKESQNLEASAKNGEASTGVPTGLEDAIFNRYVYYQYAYSASQTPIRAASDVAGITNSAGTLTPGAPSGADIATGWQDIEDAQNQDVNFTPNTDESILSRNAKPLTFIRSEYSTAKDIKIEKIYTSGTGNIVETGMPITVTVEIKNTSNKSLKDVVYLEEPDPIVHLDDGLHYSMMNGGKKTDGLARELLDGDYTYGIDNFSLAAGSTAVITYTGAANPVDIGRINV
jgi:hypothetical protein